MPDLPNWVYDLVNNLDEQELHPRLLFESGAFEGTRTYDWCACTALRIVPEDVRAHARAIAAYKRHSEPEAVADA